MAVKNHAFCGVGLRANKNCRNLPTWILAATAVWVLQGSAADRLAAQTNQPVGARAAQSFELQVVGPNGKPVPDVIVVFRTPLAPVAKPVQRGELVEPGTWRSKVKADAEGRLVVLRSVQDRSLVLMIQQPGYGQFWAAWGDRGNAEEIPANFVAELDAGWSVGGVVVDGDGNPVEGATVNPNISFKKRAGDLQELGVGNEMVTDAEGKWRYDCVPDSLRDVHVTINHQDYMPERRRVSRGEFGIGLAAEPVAKIALKRGVMVTGTVRDEAGKPIAGAIVFSKFVNEKRESETAEDGTYFLAGCEPRMTRMVVRAPGRALELKPVQVESGMDPVDFTLRPGGKIRVRVVDENDRPLPRSRIFFQKWRGPIDYFEFEHINQYTDGNGVWEWNEAPLDEFKADICPPNGMQLEEQPLVARDEEYVFRRVPLLVISGTVVDAESKQPIEKFRVVPANQWSDGRWFWSEDEGYDATGGTFRLTRNRGGLPHKIRVQASGYQAAMSREIKFDEGDVTIDVELSKGQNLVAVIETPDGQPAAKAKVVVGIDGSQINIENGEINDGSTYAPRHVADEAGRINIAPPDSAFQLILTHPSGFAQVKPTDGAIPATIRLTPWAKVEGVFRVGPQPAANASLHINTATLQSYGEGQPHIFTEHAATTGPGGRFVFDRVLPGKGRIGRNIVFMVEDGATEITSSKMVPLQLEPGETTRIELGGNGRAVIGRLAPPATHKEKVQWSFAMIRVQPGGVRPRDPAAPADVQNDNSKYATWWKEWSESAEGKAWRAEYEAYEKRRETAPYFTASVARDGTFRIDDVSPGDYTLSADFNGREGGRLVDHRFTVPASEDGQPAQQPVDLGVLKMEEFKRP